MSLSPLAGKPAPHTLKENIPYLISQYYLLKPDPNDLTQAVSFGTSGHRGTTANKTFNEAHIAATTQAIVDYRQQQGYTGPVYLGMDTHALSEAAQATAIQVLTANQIDVIIQSQGRYTPTPVISHAILTHNARHPDQLADGIIITPSHNPPQDGGFKYNPPNGGPADTDVTDWIQQRANRYLEQGNEPVKMQDYEIARTQVSPCDLIHPYVADLENIIDMQAIKDANLKLAVDPMGGAGLHYWEPIAEHYGLNIEVVNPEVDPTFSFMTVDKDGKIRMDCSSPYAMAGLIQHKDHYDLAFGNDPDADRHGIVTRSVGLMNPNHYLAVAIHYLFQHRPHWPAHAQVGKTLVSSALIDRIAQAIGRTVTEVPVGFKWFVDGLSQGTLAFGGEESAGASFLRMNGQPWSTDKDGLILNLLAAEILAVTGKDPGEYYQDLTKHFGTPYYQRIDAPANAKQKSRLKNLSPQDLTATHLAGDPITAKITHAPGNGAPIGGLKVTTENGWFAARPSGTEAIYKIYAESFISPEHLQQIIEDAQQLIHQTLSS